MRVQPLDAHDDVALRAWHDTFLASHRHERPYAVPLMLEEIRAGPGSTFNAEVNSHVIGVNERMGFRPVERMGQFQMRL